ncbi:MAG: DNA translocase FtsK 4TM domain-containing protein, partial [Pseudomonadota bacterium]|nr:DNA translocase FtsK 4TM domain-containing protein [Pseudomonadota bacterium]
MPDSAPNRSIPFREMALVLLGTCAIFLLLAIMSYSPDDPSFNFTGTGDDVRNLVGSSGAFFADLTLLVLGWVAYSIPVLLTMVGLRLLQKERPVWSPMLWCVRASGWFGLVICLCILFELHSQPSPLLPSGNGGFIGVWLGQAGVDIFGRVGLTVLICAGAIIGLQAALGFSWIDVATLIIRLILLLWRQSVIFLDNQFDRYKARRVHRLEARQQTKQRVEDRQAALQKVTRQIESKPEIEILPKAAEQKPAAKISQKRLFDSKGVGELPDIDLLDAQAKDLGLGYSADVLAAMSTQLELKLADFGVEAEVVSVLPGPVVTRFEVQPAAGVKVQKISGLAKDLARSLAVISVRIVEVIPGKSFVGIEIPNEHREMVQLQEVIRSTAFQDAPSVLTLALGKDISGASVVADLAKMPHLLVAGTTGSGKSVGVNAMLLSLLLKATPDQVRMILVDPKMLELSVYEGVPHLLTPVVTDMKEAAHALNWCVAEMERRYRLMAAMGVRNLAGFNRQVNDAIQKGEPLKDPLWKDEMEPAPDLQALPAIVVVIDEFADMMMVVGKKVEQLIARIAQKARAAGIHLVLATQRPSVDVITGLIKANIPSRISFQVSSKIDSRTVLDQGGAEQLLGHGDMLYLPPGTALPQRVHGAFVSDDEVHRVVSDWKQRAEPDYLTDIVTGGAEDAFVQLDGESDTEQDDALYDEAVQFVLESRRASISSVQRKLRVGYNRAARLIEAMEAAGVVSPMNANGSREILVPDR